MLPIDNEFSVLYVCYGFFYLLAIVGLIRNKSQRIFKTTLLLVGLSLNIPLFTDLENFKGGGSLVVLFYSAIILNAQIVVWVVVGWKRRS
jgi:hypothetical protein